MYSISYEIPAPIEFYDVLHAAVTAETDKSGEGLLVHIGRTTDRGFQIIEVWESKEHFDTSRRTLCRGRSPSYRWPLGHFQHWTSSSSEDSWCIRRNKSFSRTSLGTFRNCCWCSFLTSPGSGFLSAAHNRSARCRRPAGRLVLGRSRLCRPAGPSHKCDRFRCDMTNGSARHRLRRSPRCCSPRDAMPR